MLGLISSAVATTAFVAGTAFGAGLAGVALMACRQRRRRSDGGLEQP